jgi:branched-chain amino acid transport system ATP-binding protein
VLEINNLNTYYGEYHAVRDVSLKVEAGGFFLVVGPNGHGKSTLLKTICGLIPAASGSVVFQGKDITRWSTHEIVEAGLVCVAEARHLFTDMSVLQNLQLGAFNSVARKKIRKNLDYVYQLFPRLKEMSNRVVSTLSGGEALMLTIGRGIMSNAKMLAIDEPSFGLAPKVRNEVFEKIESIRQDGTTILLVEQNVSQVVDFAHRICLIEDGQIVFEGDREAAFLDEHVNKVFLGG